VRQKGWFSPELWSHGPDETLDHIARAAVAAEELRLRWPGRIVFSVGTELTWEPKESFRAVASYYAAH
jgi:hypothetical protein